MRDGIVNIFSSRGANAADRPATQTPVVPPRPGPRAHTGGVLVRAQVQFGRLIADPVDCRPRGRRATGGGVPHTPPSLECTFGDADGQPSADAGRG